jgi:hypothetical protein
MVKERYRFMSRILFAVLCSGALLQAQTPPAAAAAQDEFKIGQPSTQALCVPASTGLPALPPAVVQPAQPQCTMPVYPVVTGTIWPVHAGGDLQTVLNGVQCGDAVVIDAGALFSGNFTTPLIDCPTSPVLVVSASITSLPAGVQVQQSQAGLMPTISTPNPGSVLAFAPGSSGWYFAGINFTAAQGVQGLWNLITLSVNATAVSQLPMNITFDRVLVHGNNEMCVRGFLADAVNFALINSQVYDFISNAQDTQALIAYNSPGPFLVANNYLEATGENIMFGGGGTPTIPGIIPSDITVRLNNLSKLQSWYHQPAPCGGAHQQACLDVKNNFECKDCQRVLVDSNIMSYAVVQGQGECVILNIISGFSALDVTFSNNLCQHAGGGFSLNGFSITATARVLWRNNLMQDISPTWGDITGNCLEVDGPSLNFTIDHNTCINTGTNGVSQAAFIGDNPPSTNIGFSYTNNIAGGPLAADGDNPLMVFEDFPPGANLSYDVFVGDVWPQSCVGCNPAGLPYPASIHFWEATSTATPPGNPAPCNYPAGISAACAPLDWATVGFINYPAGNYQLAATSPYYGAASDGSNVGANVAAVLAAVAGVAPHKQ